MRDGPFLGEKARYRWGKYAGMQPARQPNRTALYQKDRQVLNDEPMDETTNRALTGSLREI